MNAGQLNEPITIEQQIAEKNEYSSVTRSWEKFAETKANVKAQSTDLTDDNGELFFGQRATFNIRGYHKVVDTMRVIWKGVKYRILGIDEDRPNMMKILRCEKINE